MRPGRQQEALERALDHAVVPHSRGGSSRTYRLVSTRHIVTVPLDWPDEPLDPQATERRADFLDRVAARVTVPTPRPVGRDAPDGLLLVELLPGRPALRVPHALDEDARAAVADVLGGTLAELHGWDPADLDPLLEVDDHPPSAWHRDTCDLVERLATVLDDDRRRDALRFLDAGPPPPAPRLRVSHHDLGLEHVLVSDPAGSGTFGPEHVTGVIDWDDAAIVDPAHDFGLVLRDLGPRPLDRALQEYAAAGGPDPDPGFEERVRFLAVCKLLEDLDYGVTTGDPAYRDKSLEAWDRTLGA